MSSWRPSNDDLADLTLERARDLVVTCFFEAQKETLKRARERLGAAPTDAALHKDVEAIVRLTFRELNLSYEHFSVADLGQVVMTLADKADAWGTPPDVIQHHKGIIASILATLTRLQPGARTAHP